MLMHLDEASDIPLLGLDFIGIVDRGTNLIEVKPTTLCNLKCPYCYANAGGYKNDFEITPDYLLEYLESLIKFKECEDIEIHFDPYGEILLYKELKGLIEQLKHVKEVYRFSLQTNGTLLTQTRIESLRDAGLHQVNITLNSLDDGLAEKLAGCNYDKTHVMNMIELSLRLGLDVVITPVWFFRVNDPDVNNIIDHYLSLKKEYGDQVRLGIQNYLVYKTGRKLGKTRQRDFGFFYNQLRMLEKNHGTKLLLGPIDFSIHHAKQKEPSLPAGNDIPVKILSNGRNSKEFIGRLGEWAVKVLNFSGKHIQLEKEQIISFSRKDIQVKGSTISAIIHG